MLDFVIFLGVLTAAAQIVTSEHTKIPSHPLTFTDEDTQIRINTHQRVGPHTHTAYEYTHIHTLINNYIPCIQNILETGSYKHTDRFSEDLYHILSAYRLSWNIARLVGD